MTIPDLVPEVDSREVRIDLVELTEDAPPEPGLWIDFTLAGDLHVPRTGQIIRARTVRVPIVDGQGAVRLPCMDPDTLPDQWVILVRKSWGQGAYPIQVPAGLGPIALAAIPEAVVTTEQARVWALTGASLVVTNAGYGEGSSGSATVRGGVLDLRLQIARGAPGLGNGALEQQSSGLWRVIEKTPAKTAQDWAAEALGFYLLPGPPTAETTRNGLPIYWIGEE